MRLSTLAVAVALCATGATAHAQDVKVDFDKAAKIPLED